MPCFLGIDVGSVSTDLVLMDEQGKLLTSLYLRTRGKPVETLQEGLHQLGEKIPDATVRGVGTTGSARQLAGIVVGADVVKNEITAHATAAKSLVPDVQTVLEIGGQDSKIILIRNGVVVDFAMNTVCAAGTGSFLDRQAERLQIPISEFGKCALRAKSPTRIAGRCAVFAESDMIHKQQAGHSIEDIVAGLCEALVRNYLANLAKGKEILGPVLFQGGVAANAGMAAAFRRELGMELVIPEQFGVMGALGAAILAQRRVSKGLPTKFVGFAGASSPCKTGGFICAGCSNRCEVTEVQRDGVISARFGDRCGKWSTRSEAV
ncbi:MAG TPA: 2-hydroxyglutaryl-CoA dehydratase [Ruminococcaceae bacterium]|nr:2-hydroxyglutaryl-CoA dehydratase [Oscillospiraceae bacterium]